MGYEFAPDAIRAVFDRAAQLAPDLDLEFSGIVGDAAHTYGYHRARFAVPSSDYSVQAVDDRKGNGWAASALDIKPGDVERQKQLTARLMAACKARDPRVVSVVREFFGTLDGKTVTGWDNLRNQPTTSSDMTHLWHVHISFYRRYATKADALAPVADVLAGVETEFVMDDTSKAEVREILADYLASEDGQRQVGHAVMGYKIPQTAEHPEPSNVLSLLLSVLHNTQAAPAKVSAPKPGPAK